jgi:hypothetical protein
MQYTIKNLIQSFKTVYEKMYKQKFLTIIILILLVLIVLMSFKNYSIDLFTITSTTSIFTIPTTTSNTTIPTTTSNTTIPTTTSNTTIPTTTSNTTIPKTTFRDIKKSDLLFPSVPVTTNAFTNFNFNFINDYLNYKKMKNDNIDLLNQKQTLIDNLNTRIGNILNQ